MDKAIRLGKTALLIVVLALLLISAASCALTGETSESKVNWLYDWNEALDKAQNENKPIMIDFYSDRCPPCKRLDSDTYSDENLSAFLNNNFISLKSNAEKSDLYRDYGVPGFPTIIFTLPDGTVIGGIVGYRPPDQFYQYTQEVLDWWKSHS